MFSDIHLGTLGASAVGQSRGNSSEAGELAQISNNIQIRVCGIFSKQLLHFCVKPFFRGNFPVWHYKDKQTCVLSFHVCRWHQAVFARGCRTFVAQRNLRWFLASDPDALPCVFQLRLDNVLHLCSPLSSLLFQLLWHTTRGRHKAINV